MKMTSLFEMSVLAAGMVAALGANAADGTINVTGNIVTTGCTIQNAMTAAEVSFGTLSPQTFTAVGTISDKKPINFVLENCPASLTSAKVYLMGNTNPDNSQLGALDAGANATGIGIALYNKDGAMIPIDSASAAFPIDAETGTANIALQAAVMSTAEVVGGGDFTARTVFAMNYN